MKEIGAVRLEVETLARGVGSDQDAQRIARRIGVESALALLSLRPHGLPVDGLDPFLRAVGAGDDLFEHLAEVALRADDVLREDEHPALVPARWRAVIVVGPLAPGRKPRAEVLADPSDEVASLGVGEATGGTGDLFHPGEQGLLLVPDRLRPRVPRRRVRLGGGVEGGDLCLILRFAVFVRVLGALVVCVRGACEQVGARKRAARVRLGHLAGLRLFPLRLHRRPVPRERDGERLDG